MVIQTFQPCEALQPFIQYFWIMEGSVEGGLNTSLLPTASPEMIFNLNNGSVLFGDETDQLAPAVEWLGQLTAPMKIKVTDHLCLLGIRFFPHTAFCFVPEHMHQFNNKITPLDDLLGSSINTLHSWLIEALSLEERVNFLNTHFIKILAKNKHYSRNSPALMSCLARNNREVKVRFSTRYMQKMFREQVGLSPKEYDRIQRFQKSLQFLKGKESLTKCAYASGYADQSHFIRDFKALSGLTPSQYRQSENGINQFGN